MLHGLLTHISTYEAPRRGIQFHLSASSAKKVPSASVVVPKIIARLHRAARQTLTKAKKLYPGIPAHLTALQLMRSAIKGATSMCKVWKKPETLLRW